MAAVAPQAGVDEDRADLMLGLQVGEAHAGGGCDARRAAHEADVGVPSQRHREAAADAVALPPENARAGNGLNLGRRRVAGAREHVGFSRADATRCRRGEC